MTDGQCPMDMEMMCPKGAMSRMASGGQGSDKGEEKKIGEKTLGLNISLYRLSVCPRLPDLPCDAFSSRKIREYA